MIPLSERFNEKKEDILHSKRRESSLDKDGFSRYNLYTASQKFAREVSWVDRSDFVRRLAIKTSGMKEGEYKVLYIICPSKIYCFGADGYMRGQMLSNKQGVVYRRKENRIDEYFDSWIDEDGEGTALWAESSQDEQGRYEGDSDLFRGGRSNTYDTLSEDTSERYTSRYTERERQNFGTKEEIDELITKLCAIYGYGDNSDTMIQKRIAEIDKEIKVLKSNKAQSGKGARRAVPFVVDLK